MRRALTFALLLTLSGASAASAAAPWSAPIAIGPSTQCAPAIAFGGSGAGLVSWSPSCVSGPRVTRLASTSGQVLATVPRVLAQPPVVYGRDRTVLLRQRLLTRATDFKHDSRTRLDVAFGRTSGSVGKARTLVTITNLEHLAFAGSPRGDLAVAWIEYRCRRDASGTCLSERRRLRVAVRPAGQAFRAPVTLAADARSDGSELHDTDPAIGFGPQGDLVVAYSGRRAAPSRQLVVLARVRRAGHGFGGRRRGRATPGVDRHRRRGHTDRRRLRRVGHAGRRRAGRQEVRRPRRLPARDRNALPRLEGARPRRRDRPAARPRRARRRA